MRRLMSLTLLALGACTPAQIELWQTWHAEDPAAAEAFVAEGCARMCDVTTEDTIFDVPEDDDGIYWPWDELAECESNSTWDINTGNGYSGGLQFLDSTWDAYGGEEFASMAYQASPSEQITVAERLLDAEGDYGAWPTCARHVGLPT